jgi:hypothetical protein
MKASRFTVAICVLALVGIFVVKILAAEPKSSSAYEYVTIRWSGLENTHIIRPGGKVEFIGGELRKLPKPDRADSRSFYLNAAMNGLSKEGYEFAGISSDDIVMKRSVSQ